MIRYPSWVKEGALKITVNGKPFNLITAHPSSYIAMNRMWKEGDVVQVLLPMHNTIEQLAKCTRIYCFHAWTYFAWC